MKLRRFWIDRIESAWGRRPIVWLAGVRRVGKTVLSRSLARTEYFDCESPRTRRRMEDPEAFLEDVRGARVVLDEVHRLHNPSQLLKLAADHFPGTRILATGSSTLQASARFRDTLTGRKEEIFLTPMNSADLEDFGVPDLRHRLRVGGLPPFFLARGEADVEFQEWMDSYWAKDIQELFRVEKRASFQRFLELLLSRSGGVFEATSYARPCEVSRPTISNYLGVLEATHVAHVIRPYSTHRATEIVLAPKVYGFDTGFVTYHRGWSDLRPDDLGILWEHYVLNEIQGRAPAIRLRYWRDKRGHEVDFVAAARHMAPIVIECKWSSAALEPRSVIAFRERYPGGRNWIVAADVERPFRRRERGLVLEFLGVKDLARHLGTLFRGQTPATLVE